MEIQLQRVNRTPTQTKIRQLHLGLTVQLIPQLTSIQIVLRAREQIQTALQTEKDALNQMQMQSQKANQMAASQKPQKNQTFSVKNLKILFRKRLTRSRSNNSTAIAKEIMDRQQGIVKVNHRKKENIIEK